MKPAKITMKIYQHNNNNDDNFSYIKNVQFRYQIEHEGKLVSTNNYNFDEDCINVFLSDSCF